jgi:hypothetical protein
MSTAPTPSFTTTLSPTDPGMTRDAAAAQQFRAFISAAAVQFNLLVPVICGIGSRESGWGTQLKPPGPAGTGDFARRPNTTQFRTGPLPPDGGGFGRGLMQIDFDMQELARTGNWRDPASNIQYGCRVLNGNLTFLRANTQLQGLQLLRGAVAAYNCGPGNVKKAVLTNLDVDHFTAHANYSADVFNRAGWFQAAGW